MDIRVKNKNLKEKIKSNDITLSLLNKVGQSIAKGEVYWNSLRLLYSEELDENIYCSYIKGIRLFDEECLVKFSEVVDKVISNYNVVYLNLKDNPFLVYDENYLYLSVDDENYPIDLSKSILFVTSSTLRAVNIKNTIKSKTVIVSDYSLYLKMQELFNGLRFSSIDSIMSISRIDDNFIRRPV